MVYTLAEDYPVLEPSVQVSFFHQLVILERLYLQDALRQAVLAVPLAELDGALAQYVAPDALKHVASLGLRGEVLFVVPNLLQTAPRLMAYYRLLYGFSKKAFYNAGPFGRYQRMEDADVLPTDLGDALPALCRSLAGTGRLLVAGIADLSLARVRDLQILTLGPQLRGGRNTRLGQDATRQVFGCIREIVSDCVIEETRESISICNDSGRLVRITFASDPDVSMVEVLPSGVRPLVSIEIKGGSDTSNIHNRLGEAEKSHQKAREQGFFEFWTILRSRVNASLARQESPTTSRFFNLDDILDVANPEHAVFVEAVSARIGIRLHG